MEKRFVAFILLSAVILIGWPLLAKKLFPGSAPAPAVASEGQGEGPPASPPAQPSEPNTAPAASPASPAVSAPAAPATAAEAAEEIRVSTAAADIVLTNAGGRVRSWRLKNYQTAGQPAEIVRDEARRENVLPCSLAFDDKGTLPEANRALYAVTREERGGAQVVTFRWADGQGSSIVKTFTFRPADPLADVEVAAIDRGRPVVSRLVWGPGLEVEDAKARSNTYYHSQSVVLDGGQVARVALRKLDGTVVMPESSHVEWAGIEDQYFTALILPAGSKAAVSFAPLAETALVARGANLPKELAPLPAVAVSLPEGKAQLFVGAKEFSTLAAAGHQLERAVWFSSYTLIYACAKPLFLGLRWVHEHGVTNYGLAIMLLTVALRLLLFPLNQYSMVKMRRVAQDMQRVQPKLKALKDKYAKSKDPEARGKLNQETMELYRREGVNPFGGVSGCLPLFIQMPILWAFFDVLTATVELRGAPFFGWIKDLTHPDPWKITPILMGGTMFVQQKMTPMTNVDPAQQRMMLFMPLMFTVMFVTLPSGLVVYYFVNNLLGIGQQWLVNRHVARWQEAPTKA